MLIYYIFTGIRAFDSFKKQLSGKEPEKEDIVDKNIRPKFPDNCDIPTFIKKIIINCWEKNPNDRKSAEIHLNNLDKNLKGEEIDNEENNNNEIEKVENIGFF
jgi:hypothetical protein